LSSKTSRFSLKKHQLLKLQSTVGRFVIKNVTKYSFTITYNAFIFGRFAKRHDFKHENDLNRGEQTTRLVNLWLKPSKNEGYFDERQCSPRNT